MNPQQALSDYELLPLLFLPENEKKEIKMRVDDELYAAVNGREVANAFAEPGWQWTKVYSFHADRDDDILAVKVYDQVQKIYTYAYI